LTTVLLNIRLRFGYPGWSWGYDMKDLFAQACAFARRFWRRREGATAVEFSLVAMPFFMLMLAIFETTAVYFASSTLENAVNDAARTIRTGQAQVANMDAAQFRQMICDRVAALLKCDSSLVVDVRSFSEFDDVAFPSPLNPDGTLKTGQQFAPGGAGDVVLVRVYYAWPIVTPLIGGTLANMAGNKRLVIAATAFRNEPFGSIL
jgi:Flp pilus assembly protein TadG